MRDMKDSGLGYLGEIPAHWNTERIKNHLHFSPDKNPGGATILSLYRELGIVPKDSRADNHNVTSEDTSNYRYVRVGDFVVNKMKAWQGSMGVSAYEGVVSPAYYVYRFTTDAFDKKYLHYLLRSKCYADEFRRLSGGIRIGQWDLPKVGFETTYVAIPPKAEQSAIAETIDIQLNKVDALIANVQAQIEKLKTYKQSVISEVVARGLDPTVHLKDSGVDLIGEIPEHYNVAKIKKVCANKISDGTHSTPQYASEDDGFPFLSSKDVRNGYINWANIKYITLETHEQIKRDIAPKIGDVLLSKNGSIGYSAVVEQDREFDIYVTLALLRPNSLILSKYLKYALDCESTQKQFSLHLIGIGVPNLHLHVIQDTKILLPPVEEQREIIAHLDAKCDQIDQLIAIKQAKIEKLEQYKCSLIYEYVTGKKEVS